MNKKLIFGLASAGFAGLFWACGSGDIVKIDRDDTLFQYSLDDDPTTIDGIVQQAVSAYCSQFENYEQCMKDSQPGPMDATGSSSSAVAQSAANPYTNPINNSSQSQQQNPNSSGTVNPVSTPSQTQNPTSSTVIKPTSHSTIASSSSAPPAADPNAWGTCAPNVANGAIEKGKSVQWKVSLDQNKVPGGVSALTKGTFSWTFDGGGDPATKSGQGTSFQSVFVSYATSGVKNATVTVSNNGQTNTIKCSELNVTGAAITGCACTPSVKQVDIATGASVTWTVGGCKSSDATFVYDWSDGLSGGASAGGILNAKGTYTPTVTIKNSDNGMMTVTCAEVVAIDSNNPDYVIKKTQGDGAIKIPAGKTNVSLEVDAYNNQVFCQVARTDSPDGKISGTVNSMAISGADYVTVSMAAGTLKKGATLLFDLSVPATCGVQ